MESNKKQQLLDIIKKAMLPEEITKLMVDEVEKQQDIDDDYILMVADTLERIGIYFKTVGEVQNEYLDSVVAEAQKVGDAMSVLNSIADELEENPDQQPQVVVPVIENSSLPPLNLSTDSPSVVSPVNPVI